MKKRTEEITRKIMGASVDVVENRKKVYNRAWKKNFMLSAFMNWS
jgi:hypothetical protein